MGIGKVDQDYASYFARATQRLVSNRGAWVLQYSRAVQSVDCLKDFRLVHVRNYHWCERNKYEQYGTHYNGL